MPRPSVPSRHLPARAAPRASRSRERIEGAVALILIVVLVASWATHMMDCVTQGLWVRLVAGLLFFPFAILNGLFVLATAWL